MQYISNRHLDSAHGVGSFRCFPFVRRVLQLMFFFFIIISVRVNPATRTGLVQVQVLMYRWSDPQLYTTPHSVTSFVNGGLADVTALRERQHKQAFIK